MMSPLYETKVNKQYDEILGLVSKNAESLLLAVSVKENIDETSFSDDT